jgi:hypothetical protein
MSYRITLTIYDNEGSADLIETRNFNYSEIPRILNFLQPDVKRYLSFGDEILITINLLIEFKYEYKMIYGIKNISDLELCYDEIKFLIFHHRRKDCFKKEHLNQW